MLITPGYFQDTYFAKSYLQDGYWQDYGAASTPSEGELLTPGYWQDTYFAKAYWQEGYWQDYGTGITPEVPAVKSGGGGAGAWAQQARLLKQARQEDEDLIRLLAKIVKIL